MKVIEMGTLADVHWETKDLPKHGIVIEATKRELIDFAKRVKLYREVKIEEVKTMSTETYFMIEVRPVGEELWSADRKCYDLETSRRIVRELQTTDREEFHREMEYRIVKITKEVVG